MLFALTTRWNAGRHTDGEAMIEEILEMGFDRVELGYDLRMDLVPGVQSMVKQKAVHVDTLHNFCPLPIGAPQASPEIFTLSDNDIRIRTRSVEYTARTIRFAAELGAKAIVVHAGNVKMKRLTNQLITLFQQGRHFSPAYDRLKLKLQITREKKVKRQLEYLYKGIEKLLPVLEENHIRLAFENLPSWEAIPTEIEMETLLNHFQSKHIGYWHDLGHGRVRENLGLINQERWMERLQPYLVGMHLHDVLPPAHDHLMPPQGEIDFAPIERFAKLDIYKVLEPASMIPREDIIFAKEFLQKTWNEH